MEPGYLGVETSEFTPPSWFREKTLAGTGGEKIVSRWSLSGMAYLEGYRCRSCRVVTVRY